MTPKKAYRADPHGINRATKQNDSLVPVSVLDSKFQKRNTLQT
jgi:hypothetical protein